VALGLNHNFFPNRSSQNLHFICIIVILWILIRDTKSDYKYLTISNINDNHNAKISIEFTTQEYQVHIKLELQVP